MGVVFVFTAVIVAVNVSVHCFLGGRQLVLFRRATWVGVLISLVDVARAVYCTAFGVLPGDYPYNLQSVIVGFVLVVFWYGGYVYYWYSGVNRERVSVTLPLACSTVVLGAWLAQALFWEGVPLLTMTLTLVYVVWISVMSTAAVAVDPFTGLYTVRHLLEAVSVHGRGWLWPRLTVVVVDGVGFSRVNREQGLRKGDKVILGIAAGMSRAFYGLQARTLVCRVEGDVFAAFTEAGAEDVEAAASDLRREVKGAYDLDLAVGTASVTGSTNRSPEALLEAARVACAEDKRRRFIARA